MSDIQALLSDLKRELKGAEAFYGAVSVNRLESLIRKYEVQTPGDISDQPGEWQIRGGNVEAIQHHGGDGGAKLVLDWIRSKGGTAVYLGLYDQEVDTTRIVLNSPRVPNVLSRGWWAVKTADGIFFAVSETDFPIIYVPREV